jgi:hypothetical protein
MCNLSLEADCVSDIRSTHPLAAEILHALVFGELSRAAALPLPTTTSLGTSAGGAGGLAGAGAGMVSASAAGGAATPADASGDARRASALPVHPKAPDAATAAALRAWGLGGSGK